jgi:hypothetical protein
VTEEFQLAEVEKTLLYISEARARADRSRAALERDGAEEHVVQALADSAEALAAEHRRLLQRTYFAVPDDQRKLVV